MCFKSGLISIHLFHGITGFNPHQQMKTIYPYLACAAIIQFFIINTSIAQSKTAAGALQAPPANVKIDGDIKEWGDSLHYYNAEEKINFSLANSKDTLYMAIRINDRSQQRRILRAGLTFSIDPKGKKKETYSITFPVSVQGGSLQTADLHQDEGGDVTQADRDELMRERITSLRGIRVVGFKDIEGDMITTSNTYGFQTAVDYDEKGYLICEAAIPLSFFHDADITKNEWSFNFKINGLQRKTPGQSSDAAGESGGGHGGRGGGGRGGRGGGGRGGSHSSASGDEGHDALYKSEDFWEKFYLAK